MSDHEASRAAFERAAFPNLSDYLERNANGDYARHETRTAWEGWKAALDYAASRECVWTGFSAHGRIHYRTCRGVLNYTEMPRLQFIPFCPGCGGRVKIQEQPQTNEEQ